jgi:hypothetical protein
MSNPATSPIEKGFFGPLLSILCGQIFGNYLSAVFHREWKLERPDETAILLLSIRMAFSNVA